jgi:hypothetical protein
MNGKIFRKKFIEHKMSVLLFSVQILSETFLILRIERVVIINVRTSLCIVPVTLVIF